MIKSFQIKNFRCFNSTKASGFSMINLFGGRNNSGKTALLEALLLMGMPSNESIAKLLSFRRVSNKYLEKMPQKVWDNFFYQQKKENQILLNFVLDNKSENRVSIICEEKVDDFISMVNKDTDDEDVLAFANSLVNTNIAKSSLNISAYTGETQLQINVFISTSTGRVGKGIAHTFIDTHFVPASSKLNTEALATEFDISKHEGNSEVLLKAFQIIDSTIEKVDTFNIGEAALYLKRNNEKYMPLSLFGDAMNRIADFLLRIVNNKNSILLIDEIENGIHYENQEDIWKILFELCKEHNVQLFATSHSYEMIEAFKNIIINNDFQEYAGYFEMARHPVSNEVTIQKIPIYSLEDKLNNKNPIRGEQRNSRRKVS